MCRNTDTQLRYRLKTNGSSANATANAAEVATSPLKPTEISIDGVVYDISSFFGGNDVTVQYKMIHLYHTEKHLEKMKAVGT